MGRRSEEDLRREAVRRRLAGESPQRIVASLGRTRRWVSKWVARHAAGDGEWAEGRRPGRVVNRTDAGLERQVVAVRRRLAENPWAQIGADAIAWELEKLGVSPPPRRTIERICQRAGLIERRRRERPKSKGLPYPAPPAEAVGVLHQADIVGPRHLDGGMPFVALNCVDIVPAAAIEIAPDQREETVTEALVRGWERLGVPRRLQLDNGKPFLLGSASLGEIARVAPPGGNPALHPPARAMAKRCPRAVQRHLRQALLPRRAVQRPRGARRARGRVRALHNANHRYRATGRRTPDEVRATARPRPPLPLAELPSGRPQRGRIEFIRFIRSDRKLRLLRRSIAMPETHAYRYVTAALDLAIPAEDGNLLDTDTDGELVLRANVPNPGQ